MLTTLIVAFARNRVIGRDGGLPWRLPSDLKRFRAVTMGKPIVMGRKTFQSIGKPLDGRANIVLSREPGFAPPDVQVARSLAEALAIAREAAEAAGADEICVIGGEGIFAETLPLADRLLVTEVDLAPDGDTFFPEIDPALFREISRERHARGPRDDADYDIVVYERRESALSA